MLDEEKIGRDILRTNGDILAQGKASKIKEILKVLDEEKIGRDILKTKGTIIVRGEANKIKEILKVLDEEKIGRDIIKTNGDILVQGKASKIKEILKVLDEEKLGRNLLKTNGNILAYGEANKIKEILKAFDEEKLDRDIIKTTGSILTDTNGKNIKELCSILRKDNKFDLIYTSKSILKGSPRNVEKNLEIFKKENLEEELKNRPSVLVTAYTFVLSRVNYLKEKGIALSYKENGEVQRFNSDIFISNKKFEKKYGINGKELKIKYGQENENEKKVTIAQIQNIDKQVTVYDRRKAMQEIIREKNKSKISVKEAKSQKNDIEKEYRM